MRHKATHLSVAKRGNLLVPQTRIDVSPNVRPERTECCGLRRPSLSCLQVLEPRFRLGCKVQSRLLLFLEDFGIANFDRLANKNAQHRPMSFSCDVF